MGAEVKWIKLAINMFEDEKIDFILSLPEADALVVIWIRLLTLAGKCNAGGWIFLTQEIPYSEEMLAHKFRRPINTVKLALETFQRLKMIEISQTGIYLANWSKHQAMDKLEKIKEQNRERVAAYRERKRLEHVTQTTHDSNGVCNVTGNDGTGVSNVTGNVTGNITVKAVVTQSNAPDIDKELDVDRDKILSIYDHWNRQQIIPHRRLTEKIKRPIVEALKIYTVDEIKRAIDNYSTILRGEDYYYSFKWTLTEFLQRMLEKFLDWETCHNNYLKHEPLSGKQPQSLKNLPQTKWQKEIDFTQFREN